MLPIFGESAAQGGAIAPNQIPSLNLWYDASVSTLSNMATTGGTAPTNGQGVAQWIDKQGFGRNANQNASTKQPTWQSAQQNSLGTIKFDGNNDFFSLNPIPWSLSLPGQTTYIVFKFLTNTDQMHLCATNTGGFSFFNNTGFLTAETAAGIGVSDFAIDTTNYHYAGQILDGTQTNANITIQNNLRLKCRVDGVERAMTFSANVGTATSASANTINVGADDAAGNFLNGYIGELLIWTRTLSGSEIAAVEEYLSTKWGI